MFKDMTTHGSAAVSAFPQQQKQHQLSTTAGAITQNTKLCTPSPSPTSSSSSSCESGVLSGSSLGSSLINSPTSATSSSAATANVKSVSSTTATVTAGLISASLLAAAASSVSTTTTSTTLSMSCSSSISTPTPVPTTSSIPAACSSLISSTTAASPLPVTTSPHQMLLNGLGVSDDELNAVNSTSLAEDPRALQLALELSMVGLNDSLQLQVHQHHQQQQQQLQQLQQQHLQHMQQQSSFDMSALSAAVAAAAAAANGQASNTATAQLNQFSSPLLPGVDDRSKKSQNMTECVPVPSSEHVAEIVGRQGCKIKALRAKTNTYIKTPVRGEEPVFVVTGRKEDVAKAKREILSAADHFSVIRAARKPSLAGSLNGSLNGVVGCGKTPPGPPSIPGQVTIQVRVPYRVVGLVVGPKGATIKHIQQETQTYIVTPSREKEPIFEVTGLPDNVQAARKQIEAHIALRTGNLAGAAGETGGIASANTSSTVHTINSLSQILSDDISPEFLASIYKNGLCSTFDYADSNSSTIVSSLPLASHNNNLNFNLTNGSANPSILNSITTVNSGSFQQLQHGNISNDFLSSMINSGAGDGLNAQNAFRGSLNLNSGNVGGAGIGLPTMNGINLNGHCTTNVNNVAGIGMSRSCSSASSTTSSKSANNSGGSNSSRPELTNIWKNLGDSLDVDEGIGDSPSIWTLPTTLTALGSNYSPSTSISPTDSLLGESSALGQLLAVSQAQHHHNYHQQQQQHILSTNQHNLRLKRECLVCGDKEVTAALVPCGHNMFCMECANRICASTESTCPVCSQNVYHAMRILA